MATIQYTSYKFHKPPLINQGNYNGLKELLKDNPEYEPFPKPPSFFTQFKETLKTGIIGIVISSLLVLLGSATWGVFSILGGIGLWIFIGGAIFSGIPTSLSFLQYKWSHKRYYRTLKRNIRKSNDYSDFKRLMTSFWHGV